MATTRGVALVGAVVCTCGGALLEVGLVQAADGAVIVHAMPAREKFLR